jgi:hypothetical protein
MIFFLAIKPGLDLFSFEGKEEVSCCKSSCDQKSDNQGSDSDKKEGDCSGKACNPFQSCGSCVIDCQVSQIIIPELYIEPIDQNKYWFTLSFIPAYAADFWQPPKLV